MFVSRGHQMCPLFLVTAFTYSMPDDWGAQNCSELTRCGSSVRLQVQMVCTSLFFSPKREHILLIFFLIRTFFTATQSKVQQKYVGGNLSLRGQAFHWNQNLLQLQKGGKGILKNMNNQGNVSYLFLLLLPPWNSLCWK